MVSLLFLSISYSTEDHTEVKNMEMARLGLILLVMWVANHMANGIGVKEVPSGIQVRDMGEMRVQTAQWHVIVVIDQPYRRGSMRKTVETLNEFLRSQYNETSRENYVSFKRRIRWLLNRSLFEYREPTISRKKRAILGFIGEISKSLFGTATQKEVDALSEIVEKSRSSVENVVHSVNYLISFVNHTRGILEDNQSHLRALSERISSVGEVLMEGIQSTKQDVVSLKSDISIESLIGEFELYAYYLDRDWDQYHRRREALELGRLTEEILTPDELTYIINQASSAGLSAPDHRWYYQNLRIEPLWSNEYQSELMFKATIPFVSDVGYLSYQIKSHPYPISNTDFLTFKVKGQIGFNTELGTVFSPKHCIGVDPIICRSGPIYTGNEYQCERGILSGDHKLRDLCEITLTSKNDSMVKETEPGEYIISSRGEQYSLQCPNEREELGEMQAGVNLLRVPAYCVLKFKGFHIDGIMQMSSNITLESKFIPIEPFNISMGSVENHQLKAWKQLIHQQNLPFKKIREFKLSLITENRHERTKRVWVPTGSVLGGILIIAIIGISVSLWKKWLPCVSKVGRKPSEAKIDQRELTQAIETYVKNKTPVPKNKIPDPNRETADSSVTQVQVE